MEHVCKEGDYGMRTVVGGSACLGLPSSGGNLNFKLSNGWLFCVFYLTRYRRLLRSSHASSGHEIFLHSHGQEGDFSVYYLSKNFREHVHLACEILQCICNLVFSLCIC